MPLAVRTVLVAVAVFLLAAAPAAGSITNARPSNNLRVKSLASHARPRDSRLPEVDTPPRSIRQEPENGDYERAKELANKSKISAQQATLVPAPSPKGGARASAGPPLFTGLGFPGLDALQCGCFPADVQVATGPTAVVEMVNASVAIWSRTGGRLAKFPMSQILGGKNEDLTDPQILYDASTGRWIAAGMNIQDNGSHIAVSDDSDPRHGWSSWEFTYDSPECPDQPRLGTSDEVVALTTELFKGNCKDSDITEVEGGTITVINKQDLLAGADNPGFVDYGPSKQYSNFVPVQSLSPTPIQYFASAATPSSTVLHVVQYAGAPPASDFTADDTLLINKLRTPPGARQPRTRSLIDTGDDRLSDASYLNGVLYVAANDACDDGTKTVKSCARIIEVTTADHRLLGEDDIGFKGAYAFYTALRPDAAGNVIAEFGYSSKKDFPSIGVMGVRGPLSGQSGGDFTDLITLAEGSSPNKSGRWGDYMGAALDPLNPNVVWVASQVGDSLGRDSDEWGTHLDAISLADGQAPPPSAHQVYPVKHVGRTSQGKKILLKPSGDGRRLVKLEGTVVTRCPGGGKDHFPYTFSSQKGSVRIGRQGQFEVPIDFGADRAIKSARLRVKGVFTSEGVSGTLKLHERSRRRGKCSSGAVSWSATY